jgi:translation initiation factor IF-1
MIKRPCPVVTTATLLCRTGDRTFIAALPNGKEIIAHLRTREAAKADSLQEGQKVRVELTTYDFSIGRIAGLQEPVENP